MWRAVVLALALIFTAALASGAYPRSATAKAAFKRLHPCPATNESRGACPGYVVDHRQALCAGGADTPDNMQWQTVAEAKIKDRDEHRQCRALRRLR